jgi:ParB-like chromosome segregation protein Spo0J
MGKHCDLPATPIAVTARGVVLSGRARLAAARECGMDELPAIVVKHPDIRTGQQEEC